MSILLIRHGETALNRARVIQPPETPLNSFGQAQARALAQRLLALPPDALVASDMPRAAQTAGVVSEALNLPVEHSELLRERYFGDWSGLAYADLDFDPLADGRVPPGGESKPQFQARVALAADWILQQHKSLNGGVLAVFSHGLVIRELLATAINAEGYEGTLGAILANTSITKVSASQPFEVSLMACDAHLEGLKPDAPGQEQPGGQY